MCETWCEQCVVRTVLTDVVISLIVYRWLAKKFDCVVFACLTSSASNRFYNTNKIAEELGERKCRALPFFYALTGCDIVSSFFNQGKCKFWDQWTESREEEPLTTVFMELSDKANALTEEQISVIEQFTGFVYSWQCKFNLTQRGCRISNIHCMEIYDWYHRQDQGWKSI